MSTDADTELGMEPGANEGSKTTQVQAAASKSRSKGNTSIKSEKETNSPKKGCGRIVQKISSISPCCCLKFKFRNFVFACFGIAIYIILTSLPSLIVGLVRASKPPPQNRVFKGALPGSAGISGISFVKPPLPESPSFGNPKFDLPCGSFGLIAGILLLVVCFYEKKKPEKSKCMSLILAVLSWVSCVFMFFPVCLALASLVEQSKRIKASAKTGITITSLNNDKESVSEGLIILIILVILHSFVCLFFMFCTFLLGFKILAKKDVGNANAQGATGGSQQSVKIRSPSPSPAHSKANTSTAAGKGDSSSKIALKK